MQRRSREILLELHADAPAELFHYTGAGGLRGILQGHKLLGGNFVFMNDASEFRYGVGLLRELAGEMMANGTSDFDRAVLAEIVSGEQVVTRADVYLACFCEKGDLLSQWRGYGSQDARYCIRFDPNGFESAVDGVTGIFPVVYQESRQRDFLTRILSAHLGAITDGNGRNRDDSVRCIYSCCLMAFAFLKNPAFQEEHEWRTVMFVWSGELLDSIDFLQSAGAMKPCVPLLRGAPGGVLPITKITAGASRSMPQSIRSAELMLAKFGYTHVPVEPSSVPLSG